MRVESMPSTALSREHKSPKGVVAFPAPVWPSGSEAYFSFFGRVLGRVCIRASRAYVRADKTAPEADLPSENPIRRRIGLLGGSFNPPHAAHREISLGALKRLGLDCVWWLVTPGNPLKDPDVYAPFEERLRQARQYSNHPDIVVSDFEQRQNLQYTVDTIERLQGLYPESDFVWLMGADGLRDFHRWKDWRRIAELVPIAVFNRPGAASDALASKAATELAIFRLDGQNAEKLTSAAPPAWIYFSDFDNPLSSTAIRSFLTQSDGDAATVTDLKAPYGPLAFFLDLHPDIGDFKLDAIEGLSLQQKSISPKYFYDERGSKLFEKITELPEYYPTRTEKELFLANADAIAIAIGAGAAIFEYGSGSSEKAEWLVCGIENTRAYVAMDISKDHLIDSATALAEILPVPVAAICADFHAPVEIPAGVLPPPAQWLGYFPGSTIGNMLPEAATAFLRRASDTLGPDAKFLIGVDLEKDKEILEAAYNDADGVTAAFNLNLLKRMKRELGADIAIEDFEHFAFYNETECRIEMHLRALRATEIVIEGKRFTFNRGETLHTENSHKYSIDRLKALMEPTPWSLDRIWTDPKEWYAACLLSNS